MQSTHFTRMIQFSSPPIHTSESPSSYTKTVRLPGQDHQNRHKDGILRCGHVSKLTCCAKEGSSSLLSEADRRKLLEKELLHNDEELNEICKLNEKCEGLIGLIESLECLEREAIMGEDEGREPTDYNRRAQIFNKSSKVFQALKEEEEEEGGKSDA